MPRTWNFDPPGRLIACGESRLHVRVSGSGGPVVVLEAGIAATSLSWALVEPEVARFTTVVSYDRAGLGWSGPALTPRTPAVIAGELRATLESAGLPGPFILAGHSFGGLVVQRFAALYPNDVVGLVLVDPLPPDEWFPVSPERERMLKRGIALSRRGAVLARWGVVGASLRLLLSGNRLVPQLAARVTSGAGGSGVTERLAGEIRKLPRELWPVIARHWSQAKNFDGMARHLECLPASAAEMASSVVAAGIPVTAFVAQYASGAGLPSHATVTSVPGAGHWIQLDRPDLVIGAIERMAREFPDGARVF